MKPAPSLTAIGALLLAACSTVTINTDFALEQDFSGYHTYAWHPDGVQSSAALDVMGGDIYDTRLRRAVEDTLTTKGMRAEQPADFYVNYTVVTEERVSINTYNTYGGFGPGWGYTAYGPYCCGPWGIGSTQANVYYYTQGTLIIDIVDARSNKLVWRGTADSRLPQSGTPEKRTQELRATIAKMFERFPPPTPG